MNTREIKYLELLSKNFPNVPATAAEIIRLQAILELPKTTEHFMSDIHGEYEAFTHVMNNCSGVIREKVQLWLGDQLTGAQADEFCTLVYYPEAVLRMDPCAEIAPYGGPVLIVHGTADGLVNYRYSEAAQKAYADCRLVPIEGADHGFRGDEIPQALAAIDAFLGI